MDHLQAVNTLASERYLLDEMTELERHRFEDHFFSCTDCAEDVRLGALMREGARTGLAGPTILRMDTRISASDRETSRRPGRSLVSFRATVVPWAAAASLAVIAGYQAFSVAGLRRQSGPQVLAPITLRPASRGGTPSVSLKRFGRTVVFAIDVNASPATIVPANPTEPTADLTYDLRTVEGVTLASGNAPAPAAGSPLLLLIPSSALRSGTTHLLTVREATRGARVLGEYRFAVTDR